MVGRATAARARRDRSASPKAAPADGWASASHRLRAAPTISWADFWSTPIAMKTDLLGVDAALIARHIGGERSGGRGDGGRRARAHGFDVRGFGHRRGGTRERDRCARGHGHDRSCRAEGTRSSPVPPLWRPQRRPRPSRALGARRSSPGDKRKSALRRRKKLSTLIGCLPIYHKWRLPRYRWRKQACRRPMLSNSELYDRSARCPRSRRF